MESDKKKIEELRKQLEISKRSMQEIMYQNMALINAKASLEMDLESHKAETDTKIKALEDKLVLSEIKNGDSNHGGAEYAEMHKADQRTIAELKETLSEERRSFQQKYDKLHQATFFLLNKYRSIRRRSVEKRRQDQINFEAGKLNPSVQELGPDSIDIEAFEQLTPQQMLFGKSFQPDVSKTPRVAVASITGNCGVQTAEISQKSNQSIVLFAGDVTMNTDEGNKQVQNKAKSQALATTHGAISEQEVLEMDRFQEAFRHLPASQTSRAICITVTTNRDSDDQSAASTSSYADTPPRPTTVPFKRNATTRITLRRINRSAPPYNQ